MPSDGTTNKVSLVIMMGESNSGGLARNTQALSEELGTRSGVQILNNYNLTFETLNISSSGNNILEHLGPNGIPDVTSSVWNTAGGSPHGWELGLANAVRDGKFAKNIVYLIKAGHGGSKLGDDIIRGDWEIGQLYFNKFEERYNSAVEQIFNSGNEPQVYVWYEIGINDCLSDVKAEQWKNKLIEKIENVRRITRENVPFFITLLPDVAPSTEITSNLGLFNRKIIEVSSEVPGVYWVKSDDCHLRQNDIYHWDYYGMKLLADRMSYLTAEVFGEESVYENSVRTPPAQPSFDNYSPIFAVTPYGSTSDPVLEYVYPVYAITGRLSGNSANDEGTGDTPSHIGNPQQAISFFNQKGIPENRRVIFQQNIGSAIFDSAYIEYLIRPYNNVYDLRDSCLNSDYSVVYQDTTDPRETSNLPYASSYSGSLPFISPWTGAAHTRLEQWTRTWVGEYKNLNGKIYGFISDNESVSPVANRTPQGATNSFSFRYDGNTESKVTHFNKIINDPRAFLVTPNTAYANEINLSLRDQLQLSTYTVNDFNQPETRTINDPQYNGGYSHWDYVMNSFAMWYANKHWYNVISEFYPTHNSSHIYSYYLPKTDAYIDPDGYINYGNQLVGDTCNILFFGFIGGLSQNCEIDPNDKTRTRFLSQYNPGGTPIGNRAWISLLTQQQLLKSIKRHPQNKKFMPWIGSKDLDSQFAFGGLNDPNHDSLWKESLYHVALHNPNAIYFFYIRTPSDTNTSLNILNDVLKQVNQRTGNKILNNIDSTLSRIELDTKVLISGCKTIKQTHLWRLTADVVNVEKILLDGQTYNVNSNNPGFWYETNTTVSQLQIISYNSTTKTLVMSSGIPVQIPHAKTEPGSLYKYAENCYAPILLSDGTADHVYINRFIESLQIYKQDQERRYRTNNFTETPSCLVKDVSGSVNENFVNGVFKPKYFYLNIENHLTNMIKSLNPTFRGSAYQYGSVNSKQTLDNNTFERVISYIKLIRKLVYHTKQVLGPQVSIHISDPAIIHDKNEWSPGWLNMDSLYDTPIYVNPVPCDFCEELLPDFSREQYESDPQIGTVLNAIDQLRNRAKKWHEAVIKMLSFVPADSETDALNLISVLKPLFPQISDECFVITGLNYYPGSSPTIITHNTYRVNPMVTNRYETTTVLPNISLDLRLQQETVKTRDIVRQVNSLEDTNPVLTGQIFNSEVQQYCGYDAWIGFYESYNSYNVNDGGQIKSWETVSWDSIERNQFSATSSTQVGAGVRSFRNRNHVKNINRRTFIRDYPRILFKNDELYKYNFAQFLRNNSSVIINWNTGIVNVDANLSSRPLAVKDDFYDQLRPCADGEIQSGQCRDITEQPYSTPYNISDNFKVRLNNFDTFNCNPEDPNSPTSCVSSCYLDMKSGVGNNTSYSLLQGLVTRKWLYDLAIEYASYDDGVAIPYKDYSNENYWFGYYGRNAQFDPFVTTPPSSVEQARQMDDTLWPHYQRSETGKRMDALAIILSARKDASLWNFYKNTQLTTNKDWPQPPADFTVDRRPGTIAIAPVSGGYQNRKYLGWNNSKYWKKDTGIQDFITDYLDWNYRRGIRRFVIASPCGILPTPNGTNYGYTSAITSSMTKRVYDVYDQNGNVIEQIINPCEACWDGNDLEIDPNTGLKIPQTIAEALDVNTQFNQNARIEEWTDKLGQWLSGRTDARLGVYLGYAIPTTNGVPSSDITIYGEVGTGTQGYNSSVGKGWQIPNPTQNSAHASFIMNELQPWIDMGVRCFVFEKSSGMFNYEKGGLLVPNLIANPVSNYKQWIVNTFSGDPGAPLDLSVICSSLPLDIKAPVLNEFNQSIPTNYPRKTIYTKNTETEVCKGDLRVFDEINTYNNVYVPLDCWKNQGRERFRKLDSQGKTYTENSTTVFSYSGNAYRYSPYLVSVTTELNSGDWNIGLHNQTTLGDFAGLDPNEMLCWYTKNTEIGAIFDDFYKLSPSMLGKYREIFPANTTYDRLWEFTPGWHDQGINIPTPIPSNLENWDGRNYLRDSDYYNKVRNEMFVKVKNYLDRGYVLWSTVCKNDFQVIKDAYRDCLDYCYEIDLYPYPEDLVPQGSQEQTDLRLLTPLIPKLNIDEININNRIGVMTTHSAVEPKLM